jgi:hypothetical protein
MYSEKYLVCLDFQDTLPYEQLVKLIEDIPKLGSINMRSDFHFQTFTCLNKDFYDSIHRTNTTLYGYQKDFIEKTLILVNQDNYQQQKDRMAREQIEHSVLWCETYKFPINYLCKYFNN